MVWRQNNRGVEEDALALWDRLGILLPGTSPEERASELAIATYEGNTLAAVSTAKLLRHEPLRQRFAFVRFMRAPAGTGDACWLRFARNSNLGLV